jgi:hypothetical protein
MIEHVHTCVYRYSSLSIFTLLIFILTFRYQHRSYRISTHLQPPPSARAPPASRSRDSTVPNHHPKGLPCCIFHWSSSPCPIFRSGTPSSTCNGAVPFRAGTGNSQPVGYGLAMGCNGSSWDLLGIYNLYHMVYPPAVYITPLELETGVGSLV